MRAQRCARDPQRGSDVFEPSEEDIASLCEFRCVLEPRAAALACRNDRGGTTKALRAATRYGRADTALHEAFFDHCGKSVHTGRLCHGRGQDRGTADLSFGKFEATMRMHVIGTRDHYTRVLKQRMAAGAEAGKSGVGAL